MQITDAAVFYSRLTKWDDRFDGLPVHSIRRLVWYPLGYQSLAIPEGGGHFVVDVSDTFALKLEAIRAYKTQFPPSKDRVFRLVEGQNAFYGASAGFAHGELFVSATTLGVEDLVKTVLPVA
ncbi:MAG TPA: LmbE family protein, partial [Planctomycetaceae bacterium]